MKRNPPGASQVGLSRSENADQDFSSMVISLHQIVKQKDPTTNESQSFLVRKVMASVSSCNCSKLLFTSVTSRKMHNI